MREKLRHLFCSFCVVSALATFARGGVGDVTVTLVPPGGLTALGGTTVEIEGFTTVLSVAPLPAGGGAGTGIRYEAGQWDMPCVVTGSKGGTATMTASCADCDENGTKASSANIPYLFGNAGNFATNLGTCISVATAGSGLPTVSVATGATRYLGTVKYDISVCAAGDLVFGFECTDQPGGVCDSTPEATNTTRFREDNPIAPGQGPLLSVIDSGTTINIPNGACCMGTQCFCDGVGQACCEAGTAEPARPIGCGVGDSWTGGETCFLDPPTNTIPNPGACACTDDTQCADSFCEPRHCDLPTGLCVNDAPPVCNDNNDCTDDTCPPGGAACDFTNDDTNTCTNPDPEGNPGCDAADSCSAGVCLENNASAGTACSKDPNPGDPDCDNPDTCDGAGNCNFNRVADGTGCTDDGNQCTNDVCASGKCAHPNRTGSCNDGFACTENDACSGGDCVGTPVACPACEFCAEPGGCVNINTVSCDDPGCDPLVADCDCEAVVGAFCPGPAPAFCVCNPCVGQENGSPECTDGDPCTLDACYDEVCVGKPICDDDGDLCTNAVCTLVPCCDNESKPGTCDPVGGNGPNSTGHCGGPDGQLCQNDLECTICEHVPKVPCDDVPQVNLVIDKTNKACFAEDDKINVDVTLMAGSTTFCIAGGQFRIEYDPSCLDFNGVVAGADPWTNLFFTQIDETNGVIFFAVGVPVPPIPGHKCAAAGVMASLSFDKIGKCNECQLCMSDENPMHTRLTTEKGDELDPVNKCSNVIRDDRAATINCPEEIDLNSECDSAGANHSWDQIVINDQCDGSLPLDDCTCVHQPILVCRWGNKTGDVCQAPKGAGDECVLVVAGQEVKGECVEKFPPISDAACRALIAQGGFFPQGRFIFECPTVPQSADHICADDIQCRWTVRVSDHQSLDVHVQLSPVVQNNEFNRCICLEGFSSCSPEVSEETCVDMTFGGAGQFAGQSHEPVKIKKGKYVCLTARDRQHSLRSTHFLSCDGTQYHALFKGDPFFGGNWLIQGNLNRDPVIDILDFGTFIGQLNQNPNPKLDKFCDDNFGQGFTHADFNGDGNVDVADFTFIQINFLEDDKNSCCPDSAAASPVVGLTEVSVKDLRLMGLGDLAVADLNGDGLVNTDDMASYLAGSRPKANGKGTRGNNGRIGSRN